GAGEAHEAAVGDVEDVGPIDAADARRRGVGEPLLPGAGLRVVEEQGEALRDAVVAAEVDPLPAPRVVSAAALPAERRRGVARAGALPDPAVFRVIAPSRFRRRPPWYHTVG